MASWIRPSRPGAGSGAAAAGPAPYGQPCRSLARVLARAFRRPKPDILDLGPRCGDSVVYLAGRGARGHVEEVEPPRPLPERGPGEPVVVPPRFALDQADASVDVVLAWEMADFVPPERLREFGAELVRVLREDGWVFLLTFATRPCPEEPLPRYRLLADDLVVRLSGTGQPRRRFAHQNRDLERALAGAAIQGIHLQRNQMREVIAVKLPPPAQPGHSQEQSRPAFAAASHGTRGRK